MNSIARLGLSTLLLLGAVPAAFTNALVLGPLANQHHVDGASCSFQAVRVTQEQADIFQWDFVDQGWLNANGRDVHLRVVSSHETLVRKGVASIGDRRVLRLTGDGLTVTLDTRATSACAPENAGCEVWSETGAITVSGAEGSSTVQVNGLCGS